MRQTNQTKEVFMQRSNQKNSSDKIYDYIIESIRQGKFKPKDRIKEQDLIQETGLSRTPIREALGILVNEGILVQDGKKGLMVSFFPIPQLALIPVYRERIERRVFFWVEFILCVIMLLSVEADRNGRNYERQD